MSDHLVLPQKTYDRLRAACLDMLLWDHIDPDVWRKYRAIPDTEYWDRLVDVETGNDDWGDE